ncbi:hypothetical protein EV128_13223 [Rhizobium azibense]|nr:hypothetical protein EV128_13223 [Rhizobium azibense]
MPIIDERRIRHPAKKIHKNSIFFGSDGTKGQRGRYCGIRMMIASTQHARPQPIIRITHGPLPMSENSQCAALALAVFCCEPALRNSGALEDFEFSLGNLQVIFDAARNQPELRLAAHG